MSKRSGEALGVVSASDAEETLIEILAIRLHTTMEHLEPAGEKWESLEDHDREFYRICVEDIINFLRRNNNSIRLAPSQVPSEPPARLEERQADTALPGAPTWESFIPSNRDVPALSVAPTVRMKDADGVVRDWVVAVDVGPPDKAE